MSNILLKCIRTERQVELRTVFAFGIHARMVEDEVQVVLVIPCEGTFKMILSHDGLEALTAWLSENDLLMRMSVTHAPRVAQAHGPCNADGTPASTPPRSPEAVVATQASTDMTACLGQLIAQAQNIGEALEVRKLVAVERDKRENETRAVEHHTHNHAKYWDYQLSQFDILMARVTKTFKGDA